MDFKVRFDRLCGRGHASNKDRTSKRTVATIRQLPIAATLMAASLLHVAWATAPANSIYTTEFGGQGLKIGEPRKGGSITTSTRAPIESLDPAGPQITAAISPMRAIFDTLVVYAPDGTVKPSLLKSFATLDNGRNWIMRLPDGLKFTDGTPFNALAIVNHINNLAAPTSKSRSASEMRQIESVKAVGDTTVQIALKEPWLNFPKAFANNASGANYVPSPTAVQRLGVRFGLTPVGAGPYMVHEFVPGAKLVMVRNPAYKGPNPGYLDEIKVVPVIDVQARLQAVIAGDLTIGQTQNQADLVSAQASGLTTLKQPGFSYYDILFNLRRAPFNDKRMRQAVIQAINLEATNKAVFSGTAPGARGILPPQHPYFIETGWPKYDAAAARKLVEDYAKETNWNKEFALQVTSPTAFQKQAVIIQQMLAAVGIKARIVVAEQPKMVSDALSGNYDAQLRDLGIRTETEQTLANVFESKSKGNNGGAGNPTVDALLQKLRQTATAEERKPMIQELQRAFTQWLPIAPLNVINPGVFMGKKVAGYPGFIADQDTPDYTKIWVSK